MAGAAVVSPLCTWLVAACDEESPLGRRSAFHGGRRRGLALSGGLARGSPNWLLSAFCGSRIQGLMSSCQAFEPCDEFYGSRNGSAFFGGNGFSLFGPWKAETTPRNRRAVCSSPSSGNESNR